MADVYDMDDIHRDWRHEWSIRSDTIYLNHGSYGPTPKRVRECQQDWQAMMADQPMDFFSRKYEAAWMAARSRLAVFVGTAPENLVFMENSTAGMNVVANSTRLRPGDEVLLTDHEYGAVHRIWQRACAVAGTSPPRIAVLPARIESADGVVEAIFRDATERTRMLIVSHITSPTAIIQPVQQICREAKRRGIAVCVDGPHAPAHVALDIDALDCDFYTASLHKWVSAPLGSGFLYVSPKRQPAARTLMLSWGRLPPAKPVAWWEEFVWPGTRDPSAYLASTAAFDLLEEIGLERFRRRCHALARYARQRLVELTRLEPQVPDSGEWYGNMASVPLPPGNARELQKQLWEQHHIEVPIVERQGHRSVRVSCHLYNTIADIDALVDALESTLGGLVLGAAGRRTR